MDLNLGILEGFDISKDEEDNVYGNVKTLYWLDSFGRSHREGDYPAIVKIARKEDGEYVIVERSWYKHGVEHRGLGRPSFISTNSKRYVHDGRPYDVEASISLHYRHFDNPDNGITQFDKKIVYDYLVNRYFLETAIHKKDVVEYARGRLKTINTTQSCHALNFVDEGRGIQETASTKSDLIVRFDEGSENPLNNESLPTDKPGKVHNYVIIFVPRPNGNVIPESHIEFLAMNLVEVRSKHAHILLSKFAPKFEDFKYFISGECFINPKDNKLFVNIQSGMNWQLNLSRFSEEDLNNIRSRMRKDIEDGNLELEEEKEEKMDEPPNSPANIQIRIDNIRIRAMANYAYVLLQDMMRGRGPKADLFGAVAELYFSQCLGYEVGGYETKTFRGQTSEDLGTLKQWCSQGVGIRIFDNKKDCQNFALSEISPEEVSAKGVDFCASETILAPKKTVIAPPSKAPAKRGREPAPVSSKPILDSLTVADLKKLLDKKGIDYPSRARKAELIELLEQEDEE